MTSITIPSVILKAARAFTCKDEIRPQFQGVHFNATKQRIEAANIDSAIRIPFALPTEMPDTTYIIPRGDLGENCIIEDGMMTVISKKGEIQECYQLAYIAKEYPDADESYRSTGKADCGNFALSARYLSLLKKAFGDAIFEIRAVANNAPVQFIPRECASELKNARVVIAPCRL